MTEINMIKKEVELPKETYEVFKAGGQVMAAFGKALEDGWQWSDLMDVIKTVWDDAQAAVQDVKLVDDEFRAVPFKATLATIIPILEGAEQMTNSIKAKKANENKAE